MPPFADLVPVITTIIVTAGVISGAYFGFRGVVRNARVQQTEAETAQTKVAIESAFQISAGWKEYADTFKGELDTLKGELASTRRDMATMSQRVETLEATVHVSATHIAQVHDWAAQNGHVTIPPIPSIIYPLVTPLRHRLMQDAPTDPPTT